MTQGTLFLVVGPSGAGKDSLKDAARQHFDGDPRLNFPRRYITRAADAGGENHIAVTPAEFVNLDLALRWSAHGMHYGISSETESYLDQGVSVVINTSRSVIQLAEAKYDQVVTLYVSVSKEILYQRLVARGRETEIDIQKRIERAEAFEVVAKNLFEITNDGLLAESQGAFIEVISKNL